MKWKEWEHHENCDMSLPMRGAWIEIQSQSRHRDRQNRRSPCGGRGLKYIRSVSISNGFLVAPHAGGAWIEMNIAGCPGLTAWSLPMRERGLKFQRSSITDRERRSLPMRGAWIEILPHR